jgi:hypothetical protein
MPPSRRLQAAMRSSRLPAVKQLVDFDFSFQPSIRREQIESQHELRFMERRENVVFLGPLWAPETLSGDLSIIWPVEGHPEDTVDPSERA